ncbi:SGNH/GDSL hydrolase family protein [bacterium]|nr:SGNH/GDSL hydrolase family protein [bacterium]
MILGLVLDGYALKVVVQHLGAALLTIDLAQSSMPGWLQALSGVADLGGVIATISFVVRLSSRRQNWRRCSWGQARMFLYFHLLSVLICTAAYVVWPDLLISDTLYSCLLAYFGALWLLPKGQAIQLKWVSVDTVLWNLCLGLLVLEGSVMVASRTLNLPILWMGNSPDHTLHQLKANANRQFFDDRYNSNGYMDEEFFARQKTDFVAAVVGDSTVEGIVPKRYNFVTVAEQLIQKSLAGKYSRVALHNFGITGTGPADYVFLTEREVLKYDPSAVVISIFVSNDLQPIKVAASTRTCLQEWLSWKVSGRAWRIWSAKTSVAGILAPISAKKSELPDYLQDWRLETPTLPLKDYMMLESGYMVNAQVPPHRGFAQTEKTILYLQKRLGSRLIIMLCPSVFQVDDDLYREVLRTQGPGKVFTRDLPQQVLGAFCQEHDIPCLDLLPAIRRSQAQGRAYHLRDPHWNTHGSQAAGQALADFLVQWQSRQTLVRAAEPR